MSGAIYRWSWSASAFKNFLIPAEDIVRIRSTRRCRSSSSSGYVRRSSGNTPWSDSTLNRLKIEDADMLHRCCGRTRDGSSLDNEVRRCSNREFNL